MPCLARFGNKVDSLLLIEIKEAFKMNLTRFLLLLTLVILLSSCVFTKVVTVPMRVGGAVISIVPVAGNSAHREIDKAADQIDDIRF